MEPSSSEPSSPIQKLLIFHLNLPETCLKGKDLGEGASLSELSESILYYHRHHQQQQQQSQSYGNNNNNNNNNSDSAGGGSTPPPPPTTTTTTQQQNTDPMEEAVQFLGLCTALYSLPSALGSAAGGDDKTKESENNNINNDTSKEIYFMNSTLVFVHLEDNVLAVAQISRLYNKGGSSNNNNNKTADSSSSSSGGGGGHPHAVRASLLRWHNIFGMLRGGGIQHRLTLGGGGGQSSTNNNNNNNNNNSELIEGAINYDGCPYPGMDQLFVLLKELRRAKQQESRDIAKDENSASDKIRELKEQIRKLRKRLPIQSIRRDLDAHYKEYLGDLSVVASRNGGASRCLVDTVPMPIAVHSGAHVYQSLPVNFPTYAGVSLGLAMRRLIYDMTSSTRNETSICPTLLGVSSFYQGQFLYTHVKDDLQSDLINSFPGVDQQLSPTTEPNISNEDICMLMGYIASFRSKMKIWSVSNHQAVAASFQNSAPAERDTLELKQLTMSLDSMADRAARNLDGNDSHVGQIGGDNGSGNFMPPPPNFMLGARHEAQVLQGNHGQKFWSPRIHLPATVAVDGQPKVIPLACNVVIYENNGFSFLLFLKYDQSKEDDATSQEDMESFLSKLQQSLAESIVVASEYDVTNNSNNNSSVPSKSEFELREWLDPGQDILFVDRQEHRLILFSDRKQQAARDNNKKSSASSSSGSTSRRLFGFSARDLVKKTNNNNSKHPPPTRKNALLDWAALGLDCRHLLASHLHLDTILAFDDMMSEIFNWRKKNKENNSSRELCTCMPLGWMFAFVEGDNELYAFFDSSIYVTVADVQSAATKLKQHMIGKWTPKHHDSMTP